MDSRICRICLNRPGSISLFEKHNDIQYSSKMMRCVNVVVVKDDGLPDTVCTNCAEELCTSYEFVNKCEASDKALRCANIANLFADFISKTEPEIKVEDTSVEVVHDDNVIAGDQQDDDIMAEVMQDDDSPYDDFLLEDVKSEVFSGKPIKRKYTKTKKFRERFSSRKSKSKIGASRCGVCGYVAPSRSAMEGHMRTHTGETPYSCPHCTASFKLKGSLQRHTVTHHTDRERKFICETCGNSFLTKTSIITHMRVHTDERPYTCPFCTKSFRQIASMIRHKRMHTGERPFTCPTCFKKFTDKSHMMRHQVVHSDEKNYLCHLCDKSVKTKNALKTHMKVHSNEKPNICNYCGMTFSLKGNLQVHIRRIHSEKSGVCNICSKTFSDLETHMRKHTGEKPFVCKICDQGFFSKRSLSNHIGFKHENASKFKCSIGECTKTFPTAMMLEFHLLKHHTNHTPYVCHHCSRGFFRTCDLTRHLKVNHMDDRIPMKQCVV